jgi:hypothetical protein
MRNFLANELNQKARLMARAADRLETLTKAERWIREQGHHAPRILKITPVIGGGVNTADAGVSYLEGMLLAEWGEIIPRAQAKIAEEIKAISLAWGVEGREPEDDGALPPPPEPVTVTGEEGFPYG